MLDGETSGKTPRSTKEVNRAIKSARERPATSYPKKDWHEDSPTKAASVETQEQLCERITDELEKLCTSDDSVEKNISKLRREDAILKERREHGLLSWTACYDDGCLVHVSEKDGASWYPRKPKKNKSSKQRTQETDSGNGKIFW